MSQAKDDEDLDRLVQECSLFLLHKHRNNTPIKRTEIIKTLMNNASRKTQNEVLKKVKLVLRNVYGLDMLELNEAVKSYLLVNIVPTLDHVELNWDGEEKKKMILLFLVLSVIYMNGGTISLRELEAFLRRLKITTNESQISSFFGDVEHLVKKEFVQQKYIMCDAVKVRGAQDDEDIVDVLQWGPRAENEMNKEKVLEYVCQILECPMTDFAEQFANINNTTINA